MITGAQKGMGTSLWAFITEGPGPSSSVSSNPGTSQSDMRSRTQHGAI